MSKLLLDAARRGDLASVQRLLVEGSGDITDADETGRTALLYAAEGGMYPMVEWLLTSGGASIGDRTRSGDTVWNLLSFKLVGASAVDLSSLLKVMTLLSDAPPLIKTRISFSHGLLVEEGRKLRAQLPVYLEQLRAELIAYCQLIPALLPLIAAYAEPTRKDIWEFRLPVKAPSQKRAREADSYSSTRPF
jgi:hypothetical protein